MTSIKLSQWACVGLLVALGSCGYAAPQANALSSSSLVIAKAEWLVRQPDEAYTLQLLTVSSPAQLQKFVDGEPGLAKYSLAAFRYKSNNKLLYVLTAGSFASPEAAFLAQDSIALIGLTKNATWVRSMAEVKRSIRTTMQN